MNFGLRFAKDHDFCSEASYPYEAKGGKCRSSSCSVSMTSGTVTGVKSVAPLIGTAKDSDLMSALAIQPLSIAIELTKTFSSTTKVVPSLAIVERTLIMVFSLLGMALIRPVMIIGKSKTAGPPVGVTMGMCVWFEERTNVASTV